MISGLTPTGVSATQQPAASSSTPSAVAQRHDVKPSHPHKRSIQLMDLPVEMRVAIFNANRDAKPAERLKLSIALQRTSKEWAQTLTQGPISRNYKDFTRLMHGVNALPVVTHLGFLHRATTLDARRLVGSLTGKKQLELVDYVLKQPVDAQKDSMGKLASSLDLLDPKPLEKLLKGAFGLREGGPDFREIATLGSLTLGVIGNFFIRPPVQASPFALLWGGMLTYLLKDRLPTLDTGGLRALVGEPLARSSPAEFAKVVEKLIGTEDGVRALSGCLNALATPERGQALDRLLGLSNGKKSLAINAMGPILGDLEAAELKRIVSSALALPHVQQRCVAFTGLAHVLAKLEAQDRYTVCDTLLANGGPEGLNSVCQFIGALDVVTQQQAVTAALGSAVPAGDETPNALEILGHNLGEVDSSLHEQILAAVLELPADSPEKARYIAALGHSLEALSPTQRASLAEAALAMSDPHKDVAVAGLIVSLTSLVDPQRTAILEAALTQARGASGVVSGLSSSLQKVPAPSRTRLTDHVVAPLYALEPARTAFNPIARPLTDAEYSALSSACALIHGLSGVAWT